MSSIKDEKGYNQSFIKTTSSEIRLNRRFDYMMDKMNTHLDINNVSVLEIGCAEGDGLFYLAKKSKFNYVGVDISEQFINNANKKYTLDNLRFELIDVNDEKNFLSSFGEGSFDYIIGNGILHHLYYDLDNSLLTLFRILKKNGKIIFIEPNLYNPYIFLIFKNRYFRKIASLEPTEMAFTDKYIRKKILNAGFSNCETIIKDFLLPNTPKIFINSLIKIGTFLEKTSLTYFAQSIFIEASKA
jgi:2-polyprenyl-3-methyl-5-hydroxy-6-metoxy-1,4-benzoquinol methylase